MRDLQQRNRFFPLFGAKNMTQINRRELMVAAAATACACCLASPLDLMADTPATTTIDAGPLSGYSADGVTATWMKAPTKVAVIRHAGKLYASSTICTHHGCTIKLDTSSGGVFACPCHHAGFDIAGNVTHRPAPTPLDRYAIAVDSKGHVIVDKSKSFSADKWTDPASFVVVK
jgi:Rieske Fe-S protein